MTTNPINATVLEAVARAICVSCEENPDSQGDARGNEFRWQDYRDTALAAIDAFIAAQQQGQLDVVSPRTPEQIAATVAWVQSLVDSGNAPQPTQQPEALAKYQPCGCVICTCEDEKQCQGCGAKHCGNRTDHPAYVKRRPAAPSGAVNVVGMPEFDGLMDHIYEHGTAAEGVLERANAFARAVLARYAPQQPSDVDEATRLLRAYRVAPKFSNDHNAIKQTCALEDEIDLFLATQQRGGSDDA